MANPIQNFLNSLKKPTGTGFGTAVSNAVAKNYTPVTKAPIAKPTTAPSATSTNKVAITPPVKKPVLNSPAAQNYMSQVAGNSTQAPVAPPITPPAQESPVSTTKADYLAAYKNYINSLNESADIKQAKTAYNDYVANMAKSVAGKEGQGRGIPLQIVRGEQEKLLRQTQPEAERLQNEIGIAQGAQQSAQEAAKAGVDMYGNLLTQEEALRKEKVAANKPVEVGGILYAPQADGSYKALTTKEKEAFNLSEGQSRYEYNPTTGKYEQTAAKGKTYAPGSNNGGISGASSITQAVIANPALYNTLTPTIKGQVISDMQKLGLDTNSLTKKPLTPAQMEAQTNANSALLSLKNLTDAITNSDGTYSNAKLITFGLGKIAYAQREIKDVITRIRTGAALNESEEKFYEKQVPNKFDTDAATKAKINQLAAFYSGIAGNPVTLELPDGSVVIADDMFDGQTRTDVRKAIADGANVISY